MTTDLIMRVDASRCENSNIVLYEDVLLNGWSFLFSFFFSLNFPADKGKYEV